MLGPEGLNGAAQAFDLPIMRSWERAEPARILDEK
jgi:hypothetical protein